MMNIYDTLLKKISRRVSPHTPPSSTSSLSDAAQSKYLLDPMRTSSHPDMVGYFIDPMGGRPSYHVSYDITNTGA
ncbi:hypothetical protein BC941DRAFT_420469 [Chlamydoabsidia padenii]|nr:hypothetical protein BC941DRAFT_420469 [Chlamydoabsidia padenii]